MLGVRQVRAYGLPEVAVGRAGFDGPSPLFPLLIIVIGLAAATIWLVALPVYHPTANVGRSCEVYVLPSGATKCVPYGKPGSWAAHQKSLRRAKTD
jgi:hypothetical protein